MTTIWTSGNVPLKAASYYSRNPRASPCMRYGRKLTDSLRTHASRAACIVKWGEMIPLSDFQFLPEGENNRVIIALMAKVSLGAEQRSAH